MSTIWPRQRDCAVFYGDPRDPRNPALPSAAWEAANLVFVDKLPFEIRYTGKPVPRIRCHRKVSEALRFVLDDVWNRARRDQRVVDDWGMSTFGGSYVPRLMRGLNVPSMHAFGCAFDFDPARNGLHDRTPHFAGCHEVLAAWETAGALWGGDWNGNGLTADEPRCDGMHWQFARL